MSKSLVRLVYIEDEKDKGFYQLYVGNKCFMANVRKDEHISMNDLDYLLGAIADETNGFEYKYLD